MTKYATVTDDQIDVVYLYDPRPDVAAIEIPDDVAHGFVRDANGGWIAPAPPRRVPTTIALWRARAVLRMDGLLEAADAAVTASGNPTLIEAWQYGNEIDRASPGLSSLADALNLTGDQVDDMFVRGELLVV